MNLSHWNGYNPEEQQEILSKMSVLVKNRAMPLPRYLLLHPEAKLSDAEVVMPPIVNGSSSPADALSGAGACGNNADPNAPMGRCGYGQRLPLLVISPYAKVDYVDHSLTDQTSILQFIEDNWNLGRIGGSSFDALAGSLVNMFEFENGGGARKLLLDPASGLPQ